MALELSAQAKGLAFPSPLGYAARPEVPSDDLVVNVLTPKSVVGAIKAGYVPQVHHSAI